MLALIVACAAAAPTAVVTLDTERSGCESGALRVNATGTSGGRQFRRASWSDVVSTDVTLFQDERAAPEPHATTIDFPFTAGPVPFGIAVTLYGYQGATPPAADNTVEYAVTYICDTLDIVSTRVGPYGTITRSSPLNYEGLWWRAPAGSESGWGINLAHQGDVIFATWFTYDRSGKAWWLAMTANRISDGSYAGILYETRGPGFGIMPFDAGAVSAKPIGNGTLAFSDAGNGTFTYTVDGVTQTKAITREIFGTVPTCVFGLQADLSTATNYQDLWYAAPAESEPGWGINFTHQGDVIFATWFTYDAAGAPLWLSAVMTGTSPGVYAGTLDRTTGPPFDAVPFEPARVSGSEVGDATVRFSSGNTASFSYHVTLDGSSAAVTQSRPLTREVFRTPGTVCH